jgi:Alginate export
MRLKLSLVATLATLVSATAFAADATDATADGAKEFAPGPQFGVTQQRQVVIKGLLDFDVLNRGQYLSGSKDISDHYGAGNIRAEFGTAVKLDEKVKVNITLAYEAESGDNTSGDQTGTKASETSGFAVVNDAYVEFKEFLGFESFGMLVGRMPVAWNLRENHGAFLYDSSADHPRVTSWDGARASWNISDGIDLTPFAYNTPAASTLFGIGGDWKPARSGDSRTFITGLVTYERKVPMRTVDPQSTDSTIQMVDGTPGDKLLTYSGGFESQFGDLDVFAEAALQRGDQTGDITYSGAGGYAGFDWHAYTPQALVLGAQIDHLSGNDGPVAPGGSNHALINNWEGVSDTLIVEHEQYGELSRLLTGDNAYGLQDLKLKVGVAFDDRNKVRLNAIYAFYRTAESTVQGNQNFGQEADLSLSWNYTYNTTIKLFGGGFIPGEAYDDVAPKQPAGRDLIYCLGVNLSVVF